ncbi:MAG TPA: 2-pyrone-4,6-dicarboxylate hydrolase, partial [Pseudolabrys sp.]
MDDVTKHDPDAGFEPAFKAPPNACDAHFHVFGDARYPYGTDIRYKPPYEPIEVYLKLARRLGFVRYVFV